MINNTFLKKKYFPITRKIESEAGEVKPSLPVNCPSCSSRLQEETLHKNLRVCPKCKYYFSLTVQERISLMVDSDSFKEFDFGLSSCNILDFPEYDEKLELCQKQSGSTEAIVTGYASIGGYEIVLGVMDSRFMMASMGSVVGEKIVRAVDRAIASSCPLILCAASGGARMQEGMIALMQMAKTSAAVAKLHKAGLLYISILTHPTTGGVTASFASLADIIMAEPGALIGFAGPRVIKQTIGQQLPDKFQRSEFLLEHGMVDLIVERAQMRTVLTSLLRLHQGGKNG